MAGSFETRLGTSPEEGIKAPVVATTIGPITLSGEQIVNGVQVLDGDRVLVRVQNDPKANGIYDVRVSAWNRTTDFNEARDTVNGVLVLDSATSNLYQASFLGEWDPGVTTLNFTLVLQLTPVTGDFIPLVGTAPAAPITGDLTFDADGSTGWRISQGELFGLNAMIMTSDAVNGGFYINTRDPAGQFNGFSFNPDGSFEIPSEDVDNNVWKFGATEFLGSANTMIIQPIDKNTALVGTAAMIIVTSPVHSIGIGNNGTMSQTGVLPASPLGNVLATVKYVNDSISGSGNLPPSSSGSTLIGDQSGGWLKASHFTVDEQTVGGVASLGINGAFAMQNGIGAITGQFTTLLRDNIAGGVSLSFEGTTTLDAFVISPAGFGDVNSFAFTNGFLALPKEPTVDAHAATKKYVDDNSGALPTGVLNDTLRHNGTTFVKTSAVTIAGSGALQVNSTIDATGHITTTGLLNANGLNITGVGIGGGILTTLIAPDADGTRLCGGPITQWLGVYGVTLYEGGTALASKYVGLTGAQTIAGSKTFTSQTNVDYLNINQYPAALSELVPVAVNGTIALTAGVSASTSYMVQDFGILSIRSSDGRLKENVVDLPLGIETIMALRPVGFDWKIRREGGPADIGFIAQEAMELIPQFSTLQQDGYYSANYDSVIPVLVSAMQQQQEVIDALEERLIAAGI